MASTDIPTGPEAGLPGLDAALPEPATRPRRASRTRAKVAPARQTPEPALEAELPVTAQSAAVPAPEAAMAPEAEPAASKPARRTRKVAAPAAPPQAAPAAPAAPGALAEPAPAKAPARKRASRRVTSAVATPEPVPAVPAADTPTSEAPTELEPVAAVEVTAETTPAPAARSPRKRAARKSTTPSPAQPDPELADQAEPASQADQPVDPANEMAADVTAEAEPDVEPDAEAQAVEDADAVPAAVPSFGVLFQAPVVVPTRRRATRPTGTPVVPVAFQDAPAGDPDPAEPTDDQADTTDEESGGPSGAEEGTSPAARRRRRRGGKGRRGRGTDGSVAPGDAPESDDAVAAEPDESDEDQSGDEVADEDTEATADGRTDVASRRRTRRRRRGASAGEVEDAPGVVTRVREARPARDEVVGVRGSTRLEAKKQRRREGREAGRRRQVITEAEFLARRESVERVMVVRAKDGRTQIGVLEDGVLVEHYVSRETNASMAGNIYLGKVQNVLPSMEAAFVDIGRGRNGVLYAGEVNWDAAGMEAGASKRIENALESGQSVLVQVTKDPIGHKGARLTSQVSLPGRYLVYVPDSSMTGISRKLPDTERNRLKRILRDVVPETAGVIVRTAAEGASEEELRADVERLTAIWEQIKAKAEAATSGKKGKGSAPMLLHGEPDLTVRVIRDVFNEDFTQMVVAGDAAWSQITDYVGSVAPDLAARLTKWTGERDVFSHHRIDEQIAKAMDRKVWLPSGGSLVIDRTEAMTVVDVNTGKFVGAGGNLEETVTRNNIEAAEEIVRQLRLRDIGGIIVIDFIDMVLESNRDLVVRRLLECLGRDRTKHQVAEVTSLGLVQMTRKRVGSGLIEVFSESCDHCNGRGYLVHSEPVERSGSAAPEAEPAPAVASGGAPRSRSRRGRSGMPSEQSQPQVATLPTPAPGGPTPAQIAAAAHAAALKSVSAAESEGSTDEPAEAVQSIESAEHVDVADAVEAPEPVEIIETLETAEAAVAGTDSETAPEVEAHQDDAESAESPESADEPAEPAEAAEAEEEDSDEDGELADPDEPASAGPARGGRAAYQNSRRGSRGRRRGRGRASSPAGPPRPGQEG